MRLGLAIFLVFAVTFTGFAQQAGNQNSATPQPAAQGSADQGSADWYQGKPIKSIVFEGLVHVKTSELDGITESYIGKNFTDAVYWDILGKLYALEYFETITPTAIRADPAGSAVTIRFTVVERPTVSRINFIGNSGLRRNELQDTVTIKVGDVATQVKLRVDELAIVNKYLEKGYPDVKVKAEMQNSGTSNIVVNFNIQEGEKIAIEAFVFEGNSVFSSRTLQKQLSLKTKGIIADGAFQESKLIADKQTLVQYYQDRGYIDANVIDAVREIRKDDKGNNLMTITFKLYEGRQYTFTGVTFEGNHIFSTDQLAALVYSKTGTTVNARRIQADLMRVSDLYYENGYIFNQITPSPVRDAEAGTIAYNVVIVERGRAHIENIIVKGNKKTKDNVILREIPLEAGDVFSKAKVMDGLRNLYNLQYFSAVTPETPPGSTDALMDLVINVEEQPTTDVQFGFTFSGSSDPDTFPISLQAQWNDKNFRGTGNMVGANVNASPDTQTLSATYTQRWMFGLPLSGSFDFTLQHMSRKAAMNNAPPYFNGDELYAFPDGFDSYQQYESANAVPPDEYLMPYNQWSLSLGASTGYRWSTFLGNLNVGGGLRIGMVLNAFDSDLYRPFDPILRDGNNKWKPATSIWTSVALDQRDIYYDPSRGYYGVQRLGWYGILGLEQEHYIRTDTKAEWFYTLFNLPVTDNWNFKAVFGIHSGLSFIFRQPQFDQPHVEDANKLAVDGMFIGRGWTSEYNRKGFALWENWAEVRIPLAPGIIAWDFFFDAAGIKKTPQAFFNNFAGDDGSLAGSDTFFMRFSFGGGFRFTIPQFPFRFSLAKRFIVRDGSVEWITGGIGGSKPGGGIDFVVSFALSNY
ncbi:MAG: outer membrane protein assembly factor BamA [Treponema sp.]|nr:outer membrane protein assembly factor BamA [Treponema sp.]